MIGRHVQRAPDLVELIAQQGHEIGNHTFSHRDLTGVPKRVAREDLLAATHLIEQRTGRKIDFFRPPGGKMDHNLNEIAQKMGLQTVLWSVDPKDWQSQATEAQIVHHVLAHIHSDSIILLYEGKQRTLAALPVLIKELKRRGWQVVTLSDLLGFDEVPGIRELPEQSSVSPTLQVLPEQDLEDANLKQS